MNPRRRRNNRHRRADRAAALSWGYSIHEWAIGAAKAWVAWRSKTSHQSNVAHLYRAGVLKAS